MSTTVPLRIAIKRVARTAVSTTTITPNVAIKRFTGTITSTTTTFISVIHIDGPLAIRIAFSINKGTTVLQPTPLRRGPVGESIDMTSVQTQSSHQISTHSTHGSRQTC